MPATDRPAGGARSCLPPYQLAKVDASVFVVKVIAVDLLCSVTCLGVSIDQQLTFADHIRSLACRCFFWIRQLRSVRRTLTSDTSIAFYSDHQSARLLQWRSGWSVRHPLAAAARCPAGKGRYGSFRLRMKRAWVCR